MSRIATTGIPERCSGSIKNELPQDIVDAFSNYQRVVTGSHTLLEYDTAWHVFQLLCHKAGLDAWRIVEQLRNSNPTERV